MNLDELQSIRDRERQSDSLQQLRESFYADVGEFVQTLRDEREQAAARADDPFDAPEVNRLTDDIKTAEQTVEAIYERRVGKLVKMASFAAADMPTEDEGLTAEERALFERMVAAIEENRDTVLGILDGDHGGSNPVTSGDPSPATSDADAADTTDAAGSPDAADDRGPSPAQASEGSVDAADLMAGDGPDTVDADDGGSSTDREREVPPPEAEAAERRAVPPDEPPAGGVDGADSVGRDDQGSDPAPDPASTGGTGTGGGDSGSDAGSGRHRGPSAGTAGEQRDAGGGRPGGDEGAGESGSGPASGGMDRTTVRITEDIGEIFGMDERSYELSTEDVVTLPAANAEPLVERDAAERLE